ncbi:MAG: hypothetical protein U0K79_06670 [Phascolarctobacterium sp.]|nr:hypothetical protein [Phascolarctobacterium sp.]
MAEVKKCYRKGGRRQLEPQWLHEDELSGRYSKRAKQFGAFAALRGYEDLLEEVRQEACAAELHK